METSEKKLKRKGEKVGIQIHHLPYDVALKILSSLSERDVCALGRCSRYWREVSRSSSIWNSLYIKRWGSLFPIPPVTIHVVTDWLKYYVERLKRMEETATLVITAFAGEPAQLPDKCKFAKHKLTSVGFCFADVERFLFDQNLEEFIILVGVFYSNFFLNVPRDRIAAALTKRGIDVQKHFMNYLDVTRLHLNA